MKAWKELLGYGAVLGLPIMYCVSSFYLRYKCCLEFLFFSWLIWLLTENRSTFIFTTGIGRLACPLINVFEMVKPKTIQT